MVFERLLPSNQSQLEEYLKLYHSLFPEWELEPDDMVISRHVSGEYFSYLTYDTVGLLGFYTINLVPDLGYALLNFMGIRRDQQGQGLGQCLLEHIKAHYTQGHHQIQFLLIEAEARPMRFYLRNGLRQLETKYRIPSFSDPHTLIDIHLLIHTERNELDHLPADQLHPVIRHILTFGYDLSPTDPRIPKCFDWKSKTYRILTR